MIGEHAEYVIEHDTMSFRMALDRLLRISISRQSWSTSFSIDVLFEGLRMHGECILFDYSVDGSARAVFTCAEAGIEVQAEWIDRGFTQFTDQLLDPLRIAAMLNAREAKT